jgi:hypothetical protein
MPSSESVDDPVDLTSASEQQYSFPGEPYLTPEAASTSVESTREPRHSNVAEKMPISVNNLRDKQVEIVAKLNEHSTLLVNIILLVVVIFVSWALYEMGYVGGKYTPTKCI